MIAILLSMVEAKGDNHDGLSRTPNTYQSEGFYFRAVRLVRTRQCSYNARNCESGLSILIRVLENGARHVLDSCHSCALPSIRTAPEFRILSAFVRHQKAGSEILAEIAV
jgi:hypothetical protein